MLSILTRICLTLIYLGGVDMIVRVGREGDSFRPTRLAITQPLVQRGHAMTAQNHTPNFTDCNPKVSVRKDGYLSEDPSTWLRPGDTLMAGGFDWAWCYSWFKEVPGYPAYRAGHDGQFWSCWSHRGLGRKRGYAIMSESWNKLSQHPWAEGYLTVKFNAAGVRTRFSVHRLILNVFVGPCPEGMEACHNNGISTDNRVSNLRWGTHASNINDRTLHGTGSDGEKNPNVKLDRAKVDQIRARFEAGETRAALAREYGVTWTNVNAIVRGILWRSTCASS